MSVNLLLCHISPFHFIKLVADIPVKRPRDFYDAGDLEMKPEKFPRKGMHLNFRLFLIILLCYPALSLYSLCARKIQHTSSNEICTINEVSRIDFSQHLFSLSRKTRASKCPDEAEPAAAWNPLQIGITDWAWTWTSVHNGCRGGWGYLWGYRPLQTQRQASCCPESESADALHSRCHM